ncbi:Lrp/AsnC family transcriptional regulator [Litoreibacter roseus]|uniref:Transcriptional regulator n=1 Tax=Litoreibacter roseus TaxID=2601869 RepID=A0A6N6JJY7_9RHOB|nr:Lrp/AsnC family transcriptional regulator [Litoreibacter roseus]GFE65749.1 transcriptional regulator [Litoreibacter roseus]
MSKLDPTDLALLRALQRDADLTTHALSESLNLSASQVGRRRQRLETEGYITGYRARLDAGKLDLTVQAFIQVQTTAHTPETHKSFLRLTELQPEIIAAWTLTGEADYLLRVFCTDLAALNRLVQDRLLPHPAVARVQSQIVMDQIKEDAPLPA